MGSACSNSNTAAANSPRGENGNTSNKPNPLAAPSSKAAEDDGPTNRNVRPMEGADGGNRNVGVVSSSPLKASGDGAVDGAGAENGSGAGAGGESSAPRRDPTPEGKRRANKRLELEDGAVYEGDVLEGDAEQDVEVKMAHGTETVKRTHLTLELTGEGKLTYGSGDVYTGSFANGKRHGKGVFVSKDGSTRYEGTYKDSKKHGRGIMTVEGCTYKGVFVEDEMDDPTPYDDDANRSGGGAAAAPLPPSEYAFEDGTVYQGPFVRGAMTGYGRLAAGGDNGSVYIGHLVDGVKNGAGTETFANGAVLTGTFEDNVLVGRGVYQFPNNGDTYEGSFKDGAFHGQGVMVRKDGSRYEGGFEEGAMCGVGKYTFPSGDFYEGEMKGNNINGQGTLTRRDPNSPPPPNAADGSGSSSAITKGIVFTGNFIAGVLEGEGTCTYPSGDVYTGAFVKQQFHGKGRLVRADGSTYEGDFAAGYMQGKGVYTFPNKGGFYEGEMANHRFNGHGTLTQIKKIIPSNPAAGEGEAAPPSDAEPPTITMTFTGNWVDGKQDGEFEVTVASSLSPDSPPKTDKRIFKAGEVVKA